MNKAQIIFLGELMVEKEGIKIQFLKRQNEANMRVTGRSPLGDAVMGGPSKVTPFPLLSSPLLVALYHIRMTVWYSG